MHSNDNFFAYNLDTTDIERVSIILFFTIRRSGATCTDGVDSIICVCAASYTGAKCSTYIDGMVSFICTCLDDYTGDMCENQPFSILVALKKARMFARRIIRLDGQVLRVE